jgi:hypothetical protein
MRVDTGQNELKEFKKLRIIAYILLAFFIGQEYL